MRLMKLRTKAGPAAPSLEVRLNPALTFGISTDQIGNTMVFLNGIDLFGKMAGLTVEGSVAEVAEEWRRAREGEA